MTKPLLSVVIPTRNSARTLSFMLINTSHHLVKDGIPHEILVVDDGSTDNTVGVAQKLCVLLPNARVISVTTPLGLGANIRHGLAEAKGEWRMILPPEDSVSVEEFHKMRRYFVDGAGVVIGSRVLPNSQIRPGLHIGARLIRMVHNLLIRVLMLRGVSDTLSGVFCISENVARDVLPMCKINSAGGVEEIMVLAHRLKYKIKEVPIFWANNSKFDYGKYWESMRGAARWVMLAARNPYNKNSKISK